jgi:hypothetical protein
VHCRAGTELEIVGGGPEFRSRRRRRTWSCPFSSFPPHLICLSALLVWSGLAWQPPSSPLRPPLPFAFAAFLHPACLPSYYPFLPLRLPPAHPHSLLLHSAGHSPCPGLTPSHVHNAAVLQIEVTYFRPLPCSRTLAFSLSFIYLFARALVPPVGFLFFLE